MLILMLSVTYQLLFVYSISKNTKARMVRTKKYLLLIYGESSFYHNGIVIGKSKVRCLWPLP